MRNIEEKARSFIDHAKVLAVGLRKPFLELGPHLWEVIAEAGQGELSPEQKCFKWDYCQIVAMTWWAVNLARIQLSAAEFPATVDHLEAQLANWNWGAPAGYSDLNAFIQSYESHYQGMSEPPEILDFTKLLVGTWLLWNLTDRAHYEDEGDLAGMLGNLAYESVAGYWDESENPITKNLEIAVSDRDAGRITTVQLISIFQEAIDNGDILEEENEFCVVACAMPRIDQGTLRSSEHVATFEARMNEKATTTARQLRNQEGRRPWWRSWT